ncbi:hypothetical protein GGI35DRAFT_37620 [Trichoderma velutinum]
MRPSPSKGDGERARNTKHDEAAAKHCCSYTARILHSLVRYAYTYRRAPTLRYSQQAIFRAFDHTRPLQGRGCRTQVPSFTEHFRLGTLTPKTTPILTRLALPRSLVPLYFYPVGTAAHRFRLIKGSCEWRSCRSTPTRAKDAKRLPAFCSIGRPVACCMLCCMTIVIIHGQ